MFVLVLISGYYLKKPEYCVINVLIIYHEMLFSTYFAGETSKAILCWTRLMCYDPTNDKIEPH